MAPPQASRRGVATGAARVASSLGEERTFEASACLAEGAGGGSTGGGGFSAAGAAAATLAVLATASHHDPEENEARSILHGNTGGRGGRGVAMVWCKDALSDDASPVQSSRFSVDGNAVTGGSSSSSSSDHADGFGGHETGYFRTFKEVERAKGASANGGGAVARVTAPLPTAIATTTAAAVAQGASEGGRARITDVYRFESGVEPVGRGHRSTVSTATHRLTGKEVAVKRISRENTSRLEVRHGMVR